MTGKMIPLLPFPLTSVLYSNAKRIKDVVEFYLHTMPKHNYETKVIGMPMISSCFKLLGVGEWD